MRKIIIPAAGKAQRFNGILKEFAPINAEGLTALENTIQTAVNLLRATHITLVTNGDKLNLHYDFITSIADKYAAEFSLIQQQGERDLLSGIATGLRVPPLDVEGGILLPDTIVDIDPVDEIKSGITFGVFKTNEPSRFSVINGGRIWTKVNGWDMLPYYNAWGIVLWSPMVEQDMRINNGTYHWYDEMFNNMMWKYGYHTFPIRSYYDIGSIGHYMKYMDEIL